MLLSIQLKQKTQELNDNLTESLKDMDKTIEETILPKLQNLPEFQKIVEVEVKKHLK